MDKRNYSDLQVILVGGIGGGLLALPIIGLYMLCLKPVIRRLLPGAKVFVFQPSIFQTLDRTAEIIANLARDGHYFHHQKTLIIGHSRGSLEALQSVTSNPDLLRLGMIQGLILMSPPFKGSPLADLLIHWFRWWPRRWRALEEIRTVKRESDWADRWKMKEPELQRKLQQCTILVRSSLGPKGTVCWPLKFPFSRLNHAGVVSDGLVPLDSQTLPWRPFLTVNRPFHHGYDTCISTLSSGSLREKMEFFGQCFKELLAVSREATESVAQVEVRELRVATYNVGILKIPIWGIPFPRTRWRKISEVLAKKDLDIIFFQELFGKNIRKSLEVIFPQYKVFLGPTEPMNGLAILVKKSVISETGSMVFSYHPFKAQRQSETLFGFEKGFISCHLQLDDASYPVVLINLHLTAFETAKNLRRKQRHEIVSHLKQFQAQDNQCHVIVGGDFNERLHLPWDLEGPSFSDQTAIHRLKNRWNRNSRSNQLDYIVTHSVHQDEVLRTKSVSLDMQNERVPVKTKKGMIDLELSDHYMVKSTVSIMRNLE
jgi:endonuclease/exonuclease/phosphatase family metal-dependent hydrolase